MKLKDILIVLIVGLFTINACDILEQTPESDLSDVVYWQSENDFRQAANYLYKRFWTGCCGQDYLLYTDNRSDNAIGFDPNEISNGSYQASANFGPWNRDYEVIRSANNLLEKAEVSDLLPQQIDRYVAEARFFRAYAYAELVKRYGDVPLILQTLDTDDEELYTPRTPREQVMDQIYEDLDFAVANLPDADSLRTTAEYGRVSSGTAQSLKSRVALFEGTWNKFHGDGSSYTAHLEEARDAALTVMQSGQYSLFDGFGSDSYRLLFKNEGEGPENPEVIWIYVYGFGGNNDVNGNQYTQSLSNGRMGGSRSLIDDYLCSDGLPIELSSLYQGQQNASSEYESRDPRLDGTIVKPGDVYFVQNVPYIPQLSTPTGYHIEKYYDNTNRRYRDHMIIRYGEVLLNYAEAVYELDENISDAQLDESVNLLRDRVEMPHLTNSFVSDNGLDMREEIRRERRIELAFEGFRYDDLVRWKEAENELPKPILGVRFFNAEYPADDPSTLSFTADSVVIVESADQRNFDPAKQYLWPIPLNELALNPNLEQNPEW